MAWRNFGWVWNVVGVQGSEYVMLLFLADQADDNGVTPLLKTQKIQRNCNLSRRAVFTYLKRLEQKGFLKRLRQLKVDGSFAENKYELNKARYFPKGEYADAMKMWKQILVRLKQSTPITGGDLMVLNSSSFQVYLQKNTRSLNIIASNDLFEDIVFRNLRLLKEAAVHERLPIRRFEVLPLITSFQHKWDSIDKK
jgi:hypothetical protein